jgi:hypothetical protein
VIQCGEDARLAREPSPVLGVAGEFRRQDFERDLTVERRVVRAKDLAHAASAQLGEDLVRTYRFSDHWQILAWATASLAGARRTVDEASEGGPPAPSGARTSYGPTRVPGGKDDIVMG